MGGEGSGRPTSLIPGSNGADLTLRAWPGSQTELASRLGISREALRLYLLGERTPTLAVAAAIEVMVGTPCRAWLEPFDSADAWRHAAS